MSTQASHPTVTREISVNAPIEHAFAVFTAGMGTWWPRGESHNVGPTPAEAIMEPFDGGRCYSRADDGTETDWGRVLAWEPPGRVVFAWLLTPRWEYEPDPSKASEVEVRFTAAGEGTRVVLEHRGFERYAEGGEDMRKVVDSPGGWGVLLDRYASTVTGEAGDRES
jgi:uncharacterized protein YndB with AHSA1/START domain